MGGGADHGGIAAAPPFTEDCPAVTLNARPVSGPDLTAIAETHLSTGVGPTAPIIDLQARKG